ncbi:MAG: hypothetical protein IMF14_02045, partial [Proteobacteria bacterium]|nr:hypothetical protein [Pseudomonadota bacterium]
GTMVSDSTAYQLAFAVTDVQIDRTRNKAYITDKNAKRLYVVNLETGLTEKYFQFTFMPERMTVSPDGNKLFVALLAYDHSYTWWDKDQFGYIGTIDLELQAHTNTFLINIDPYDIVVNSSNKLIVASGSGQWTMIYAYDASDGSVLGSTGIRQKSRLSLHPSGNWVFAANTDSSPSDIEKFDISGIGITLLGDSPYHGDYRMNGNVWVTPDGNYVITRGGDIFLSSDMTYVTGLTATGTNIQDLSFDNASGSVSIIGESFSSSFVYTYDLTDWSLLSTSNALSNPQYLMMTDSLSYLLSNPSGTPVIASPP